MQLLFIHCTDKFTTQLLRCAIKINRCDNLRFCLVKLSKVKF